ncbi:UNVERIFIED_ORG: zinc-binding alcohol dehydrogenase family protein (plasmid) [Roseateles sp. XES5]|nr:zinc-binding alcohol dehydrogenase family protein [Roseateles sp. XES5]
MHAVGFQASHPATHPEALQDFDLPVPVPGPRDLLVKVAAAAVNPIDCKLRMRLKPEPGKPKILGFDAAGIVEAVGSAVTSFKPGDAVYYAGSMQRDGSNAEYQLVDERLVGHKPETLDFATAAALPLTCLTAWELLFEKLNVSAGGTANRRLLVVGGAGGVGSALIQIARQLTDLTVIATASRPDSAAWCRDLGAQHVIDHNQPMPSQLEALGIDQIDYTASLTASDQHMETIVALTRPFGQICVIDDLSTVNIGEMKRKSLSLHWEFMFAKSNYGTGDLASQGKILNTVAGLVDKGVFRSTVNTVIDGLSSANVREAHAQQEAGRTIGKTVLRY